MTTLSRSAEAVGLAELADAQAVAWGDGPGARSCADVPVPDVNVLKQQALLGMQTEEIAPVLAQRDDGRRWRRGAKPDAAHLVALYGHAAERGLLHCLAPEMRGAGVDRPEERRGGEAADRPSEDVGQLVSETAAAQQQTLQLF